MKNIEDNSNLQMNSFNLKDHMSTTNPFLTMLKRKSIEMDNKPKQFDYSSCLETFSRIYDALRILYQDGEYRIIQGTRLLCDFPQFSNAYLEIYVNSVNQVFVLWEETKSYQLIDSCDKMTMVSTRKKVQGCIDIVRKIQWKHFCVSLTNTMNEVYTNHRFSHFIQNDTIKKTFHCYFFIATIDNPTHCILCLKLDNLYKLWNIYLTSPSNKNGEEEKKDVFISDYMKISMDQFYLQLSDFLQQKDIVCPEDIENKNPTNTE